MDLAKTLVLHLFFLLCQVFPCTCTTENRHKLKWYFWVKLLYVYNDFPDYASNIHVSRAI